MCCVSLHCGSLAAALMAGTRLGGHAARGAGLDLSDQPDAHRPARGAAGDRRQCRHRPRRRPAADQRHRRAQPRPDPQRHPRHRRQGARPSRPASTSAIPLFSGGSVRNSIRAAKTRVEAGRATLRAVEGDVFTEAVAAYMDVIRDRAIVELNANNVQVLDDQPRGDQRPLRDRRPHPHRRRPVRSAAAAWPRAARRRRRAG